MSSAAQSGPGSTLVVDGDFALATSNTTAAAALIQPVAATGLNNQLAVTVVAVVGQCEP